MILCKVKINTIDEICDRYTKYLTDIKFLKSGLGTRILMELSYINKEEFIANVIREKEGYVRRFLSNIYNENIEIIKSQAKKLDDYFDKNISRIDHEIGQVFGIHYGFKEYIVCFDIISPFEFKLGSDDIPVCYKMSEQAIKQEIVYNILLNSWFEMFRKYIAPKEPADNDTRELEWIFAKLGVNILFRLSIFKEYRIGNLHDKFLSEIHINGEDIIEIFYDLYDDNDLFHFMKYGWDFMVKNKYNILYNSNGKNYW